MQNVHIEVRHLRLVVAIASEGNVTRAAGTLRLSQSAVSHQLLDLERDLGTRLFDRVGKRMVPTAVGARMVADAGRVLKDLVELEQRVVEQRPDARVPFRITASCFMSYSWLPTALAHFGESRPNLDLEIVLEATRRAVPALLADEVDLAIVTDPPRDESYARTELVVSELVAIASPNHPVVARCKKGALRWSDLHDCELLVFDIADPDLVRLDRAIRETHRAHTGEKLTTPLQVRKIPVTDALLELVRSGRGVGIVDRWAVAPSNRSMRVLSLSPRASRTFHAVWRESNPRKLPVDELVAVIKRAGVRAVRANRDKA
ncbi:MAG: LysR family transcriptional regulator [Myxococcota bacterium]|nr:LysR family transcriptional regulator [Deltaproteobacteria bacterium]MDQ3339111.1 LysR family transcriptional regulator [Myxococcota bacterium]